MQTFIREIFKLAVNDKKGDDLSAILAWLIFAENLSLLNWLSFFVILLGIYLAVSNQEVVSE